MYPIFLAFHILAGTVSLITGCIAMFSKKGGPLHLRMGKIYYIAMISVVVSAALIQFVRFNPFLLLIAFFTFYFVYMGKRVLTYKGRTNEVESRDIYVILAMFCLGLLMIAYSFIGRILPTVMQIFGIGAMIQSAIDFRKYKRDDKAKNWWLKEHIGKIGGSYIAATTAFVVVNAYRILPEPIPEFIQVMVWIGPGFIGNFFIIYAVRKYSGKRKQRKSVLETA
ncbi:MAG: hypothetical protein KDD94_00180 [Calditrichaeota bacterium]|nr:hypothetical protein [Calditrichota bacterium]